MKTEYTKLKHEKHQSIGACCNVKLDTVTLFICLLQKSQSVKFIIVFFSVNQCHSGMKYLNHTCLHHIRTYIVNVSDVVI